MINVSITELLNGRLGSAEIGMDAHKVEDILRGPDDIGNSKWKYKWPCIWKYSDFELHFLDGSLSFIHIEKSGSEGLITGGNAMSLYSSEVHWGMSEEEFCRVASKYGIDIKDQAPINPGTRQFKALRATLIFEQEDDRQGLVIIDIN